MNKLDGREPVQSAREPLDLAIMTEGGIEERVDGLTRPSLPYLDMTFGMGKEEKPAIGMTQYGAIQYCHWLYLKTGIFYRLPTEAEWEWAARAGGDVPSDDLQPDANIWEKVAMVKMFAAVFFRVAMIRPDVVVTTGAAPGLSALMVGKLFGARTMWIDSIANSEQLSGSGKVARHFADVWLTQWEHLAADSGPQYWGGVL